MLCESWTYGIVAHTFDIRLQLKLFKFPVNYFLRNLFVKRHGVTASFHTNEPAGTQTSISALLTCRSEIKNAIQNTCILAWQLWIYTLWIINELLTKKIINEATSVTEWRHGVTSENMYLCLWLFQFLLFRMYRVIPCQMGPFLAIFALTPSDFFYIWHTCRYCLETNTHQIWDI